MINDMLLALFVTISVGMVLWGLSRPKRVFEYPFLAGSVWLGYLLPQVIGVWRDPSMVPPEVLSDRGLELLLLMYSLCALGGLMGYLVNLRPKPEARLMWSCDMERLYWGGLVLLAMALWGYAGMARLCGGMLAVFSTEGARTLKWRGLPVAYTFFIRLVYPGLACCLLSALRRPKYWKWGPIIVASLIPLANVVLAGRRSQAASFALTYGLAFHFSRGWIPRRWMALLAVVLAAVAVVVAPEYRAHSQIDGDWSKIKEIEVNEEIEEQVSGKGSAEVVSAMIIMSAFNKEGTFGYGRGFYNILVYNFVPRLFVSDAFKQALLISVPNQDKLTMRHYGWRRKFSTVVTGPCDAFREFWLFGMFLYFGLAVAFKALWNRAGQYDNGLAQVIYVAITTHALGTVSGTFTSLAGDVVYYIIFLAPVLWLTRRRFIHVSQPEESLPGNTEP